MKNPLQQTLSYLLIGLFILLLAACGYSPVPSHNDIPSERELELAQNFNGSWEVLPGSARDIGIGADGSVWVIGTNSYIGGYGIHRWNGSGWDEVGGAAVRIDVDPTGNPWVVNDSGTIFKRVDNNWEQLPGSAKDIGIGADGSVWIIGTNSYIGGYGIHRWNGSGWDEVGGAAVRIDVDPTGTPWVVNDSGAIFKRVGNNWEHLPGIAKDIGIGADGSVWVIGTNSYTGGFGIFRWNGSGWNEVGGAATDISVGKDGLPWVVNSANTIFQRVSTPQGNELLDAVNTVRQQARKCGDKDYPAVPPLTWDSRLATAAKKHSQDMADNNYFSHTGLDGSKPKNRIEREGYAWSAVGENISAGREKYADAIEGWLKSPGHCENMMDPDYTQMGAGYGYNENSKYKHYWTQVFAKPQN